MKKKMMIMIMIIQEEDMKSIVNKIKLTIKKLSIKKNQKRIF